MGCKTPDMLNGGKLELNNLRQFIILFNALLLVTELINQFTSTAKVACSISFIPSLCLLAESLKFALPDYKKQSRS
jgi:hypothetical protein